MVLLLNLRFESQWDAPVKHPGIDLSRAATGASPVFGTLPLVPFMENGNRRRCSHGVDVHAMLHGWFSQERPGLQLSPIWLSASCRPPPITCSNPSRRPSMSPPTPKMWLKLCWRWDQPKGVGKVPLYPRSWFFWKRKIHFFHFKRCVPLSFCSTLMSNIPFYVVHHHARWMCNLIRADMVGSTASDIRTLQTAPLTCVTKHTI